MQVPQTLGIEVEGGCLPIVSMIPVRRSNIRGSVSSELAILFPLAIKVYASRTYIGQALYQRRTRASYLHSHDLY